MSWYVDTKEYLSSLKYAFSFLLFSQVFVLMLFPKYQLKTKSIPSTPSEKELTTLGSSSSQYSPNLFYVLSHYMIPNTTPPITFTWTLGSAYCGSTILGKHCVMSDLFLKRNSIKSHSRYCVCFMVSISTMKSRDGMLLPLESCNYNALGTTTWERYNVHKNKIFKVSAK